MSASTRGAALVNYHAAAVGIRHHMLESDIDRSPEEWILSWQQGQRAESYAVFGSDADLGRETDPRSVQVVHELHHVCLAEIPPLDWEDRSALKQWMLMMR